MKELGYLNFNHNLRIVEKYKSENKLEFQNRMFTELGFVYNGPNLQSPLKLKQTHNIQSSASGFTTMESLND